MKRFFLLLTLSYFCFLTSCDSNKSKSEVQPTTAINTFTAKINGTAVAFNVAVITKETHPDYTDLVVTISKTGDNSKGIVFNLEQLQTGEDSCYYFLYTQNEVNYAVEVANSFSTNITTNTAHNLVGTFTGRLYADDQLSFIDITEGELNIMY